MLNDIIEEAFIKLRNTTPTYQYRVAKDTLDIYWATLSNDEKLKLAEIGFSSLLNQRVSAERQQEIRAKEDAELPVLIEMHESLGLTCRHMYHSSYKKCVEKNSKPTLLETMGDPAYREIWDKFTNSMVDIMDEYANAKLKQILLAGADGQTKSLWEFKLNDISYWFNKAAGNETSWHKRKLWFSEAEQYMVEQGANIVSELSSETVLVLNESAGKVWSK